MFSEQNQGEMEEERLNNYCVPTTRDRHGLGTSGVSSL